jgi:hypothetical protein
LSFNLVSHRIVIRQNEEGHRLRSKAHFRKTYNGTS